MSHEPIEADDLDRLIREHLPPAIRFATRLTGRTDTAEAIVQQNARERLRLSVVMRDDQQNLPAAHMDRVCPTAAGESSQFLADQ